MIFVLIFRAPEALAGVEWSLCWGLKTVNKRKRIFPRVARK